MMATGCSTGTQSRTSPPSPLGGPSASSPRVTAATAQTIYFLLVKLTYPTGHGVLASRRDVLVSGTSWCPRTRDMMSLYPDVESLPMADLQGGVVHGSDQAA